MSAGGRPLGGTIVTVGAGVGTAVVSHIARTRPGHSVGLLVVTVGALGGTVSMWVNWLILRLALPPLRSIEETARRVEAGGISRYRIRLRRLAAGSMRD